MMKLSITRSSVAWLAGLLLLTTAAAHGARLETLFQAEVDAAGRGSVAREAALKLALREVLVRVTGSAQSASESEAQSLLKQPGRYVEQFRFLDAPQSSPGQPAQLRLWVQFDGVALSREIRRAGLPYWGPERPDVLVWLAIDDNGRRYLVSETGESSAATALVRAARHRGVPLTLPLMDLEDQRAVQFTDVWGGFIGTINEASQRYRPQVILLGKLGRSGTGRDWRTEWTLLGAGSHQSWTAHAQNLAMAVDQGVAEAGGRLAVQYAVVATDESMRTLAVDGIEGLEDYARVAKYLASLTPVAQVQVTRVSGREVEFSLKLNADERNLLQVMTLGKVLQAIDEPQAWRFRLNP